VQIRLFLLGRLTSARITNAGLSSRRYFPFTYLPSSTARPAMSPITPGPAQASSHSSSGPSVAWPHGLPFAQYQRLLRQNG
jgi:hypothetical protein